MCVLYNFHAQCAQCLIRNQYAQYAQCADLEYRMLQPAESLGSTGSW